MKFKSNGVFKGNGVDRRRREHISPLTRFMKSQKLREAALRRWRRTRPPTALLPAGEPVLRANGKTHR